MELLQDFLLTASLALLFSLLVAKLVSMAMAADAPLRSPPGSVSNVASVETEFQERRSSAAALLAEEEEAAAAGAAAAADDGLSGGEDDEEPGLPLLDVEGDRLVGEKREENAGEGGEGEIEATGGAEVEEYGKDKQDSDGGNDEEDWEGIERSELEKVFGAASEFVAGEGREAVMANVSGEVQMQLYGLHKIATEGPCYEPQPTALKFFARAKWNSWQKLGSMSPEEAMEQYISLLNDNIPGWMGERSSGNSPDAMLSSVLAPNLTACPQHQPTSADEKRLELDPITGGGNLGGGSSSVTRDEE